MKLSLFAAAAVSTLALTACGSTVASSSEALRGTAQDGSGLGTVEGTGGGGGAVGGVQDGAAPP
ncbi:MAG: hypothetical protein JWM64_836, partial [Frankiales bacterium]|nr:hypothetical protein [Frankiales bacterium]